MDNKRIRLAGVKFNNDSEDGGQSRQKLLQKIFIGKRPVMVTLDHTKWHNPDTNEWENAIKVRYENNVIGWVPKIEVPNYQNRNHMVLTVKRSTNTGTLYGIMRDPIKPTQKQYHTVKRKCVSEHRPLPAYDKIIYAYELKG